jgi:hypothetical protein
MEFEFWLLLYTHKHQNILGVGGGNGAQNMVTVQSGFRTRDLMIIGPTHLPTVTRPTN